MEVAKLQVFDGTSSQVSGFIVVYKLYLRMKIRGVVVEEQIQWILLYVQRGLVDVWKKNMLEDLKRRLLEYETAGEFLVDIKREFEEGDKKK